MKRSPKFRYLIMLALMSIFAFLGCDSSEEIEEVQDEHICEHLSDGPAISITATETEDAAISALAADDSYRIQAVLHTRYDIELRQDTTLLFFGYIPYKPIDGTGDYLLYLDKTANVQLINLQDSVVVIPESVTDHSDYCETVKFKALYELNQANTYLLYFVDNIDSSIGAVFVAAEDEHEH